MWRSFWQDEAASVLTTEVVLLTTLLVIGVIVGAKSFRDSAVTEWGDYAQAIANIDQSYNVPNTGETSMDGSGFLDRRDFCDTEALDHGPTESSNGAFLRLAPGDAPVAYEYGVAVPVGGEQAP